MIAKYSRDKLLHWGLMGRPKRTCLPSPEREAYVSAMRSRGLGAISVGCINRYIDEFLRFALERYGCTRVSKLPQATLIDYGHMLQRQPVMMVSRISKFRTVCGWLRWCRNHGGLRLRRELWDSSCQSDARKLLRGPANKKLAVTTSNRRLRPRERNEVSAS
jgi:hypothetical protein